MSATDARSVVCIHPPKLPGWIRRPWRDAFGSFQVMPVGLVGLANLLASDGFAVRGLNYAMELDLDPDFDLRAWLRGLPAPLFFLVDLHWLEHAFGAVEVARVCAEEWPDAPVVLGGLTASQFAAEILAEFPQVSFVVRGDAEAGVAALARHIAGAGPALADVPNLSYRAGDRAVDNPLTYVAGAADLDMLDFVSLEFLEHREQYHRRQSSRYGELRGQWLCVGRGCVHDCCWCGGGRTAHRRIAGRRRLVLRSPERLASDLERVAGAGLDQAALTHDLETAGREYWRAVLQSLRRMGSPLGLWHQAFGLPSTAFLDAFAGAADLQASLIELSPLSGSEEVRRRNGKRFTDEQFMGALAACRERDIPLFVYFSLNLPGETAATFERTLDLARRVRDVYPARLLRMSNMLHTLDPASALWRNPGPHGARRLWDGFLDYYRYAQQPPQADSDRATAALRGFETTAPRPLTQMHARWVGLCHEIGEDTCVHFP